MKVAARQQVEIPLQTVEAHWRSVFEEYDRDRDGVIPARELAARVKSSDFSHNIPPHAVKKIISKFDSNCDGLISYEEFITMVESDEGKHIFNNIFHKYIRFTVPRRSKVSVTSVTDGEYEEEYSCNPPAIGMLFISIIEVAVFTYDHSTTSGGYLDAPAAELFIYDPNKKEEAWRFLTYMFVHIGPYHLIVNLCVQILLGIPLEMVHQWWRVIIVYLCGVVAGSLGTSVSDPHVYLAGASGGVYAIIAAHLATIIMNWKEMQFAPLQLIIFIALGVCDVGAAVHNRYFMQQTLKIGYVAHLAGAIAGLLVGLFVLRNLQVYSWEKRLAWTAMILFIILILAAIVWNIVYM